MIQTPGFLLTILAFVLVIGPLVFVHEMGHYLVGRWFGIKADAFSIGFGREIAGWTDRRGTRWKVGWLPLGGYVKFAGDMNAVGQPSADWLALPAAERQATFQAKPVWQRAIVVAAGPMVNFLAAILILAGFAYAYGDPGAQAIAGKILPGSAAAAAGMQPGDRIVAFDGQPIESFSDVIVYVSPRADKAVQVTVQRNGTVVRQAVRLGSQSRIDATGKTIKTGLLGLVRPTVSLIDAPLAGVRRTGEILDLMVGAIRQIVVGDRSIKELGGPLSIAKVSGEQMTLGIDAFVFLIALVSINLGFINLLPVPMLDGGHLMFYAIEAVRRRPVGANAQEWAYRGGLAAILALMLVVTFNDLGNFGLWRSLAGLIRPG